MQLHEYLHYPQVPNIYYGDLSTNIILLLECSKNFLHLVHTMKIVSLYLRNMKEYTHDIMNLIIKSNITRFRYLDLF